MNPLTPSTLYAGTYGGGVFRSKDSGVTWTAVNTGLTIGSVTSLAINPLTPTTLYAGTYGGIFRSVNGGTTWKTENTELTAYSISCLAINPKSPTTLYAGTNSGILRSTNSGISWTLANAGILSQHVSSLAINSTTPATLYIGTKNDGVFRSLNTGATWTGMHTDSAHRVPVLVPYRKGNKWGFCDSNKNIVIPTVYDQAGVFEDGIAPVMMKGKQGFINTKGAVIIPLMYYTIPRYSELDNFSEGLFSVVVDGKAAYIDKMGRTAIQKRPSSESFFGSFHDGLASYSFDTPTMGYHEGFVNKMGKVVVQPVYSQVEDYYGGFAAVQGSQFSAVNTSGQKVSRNKTMGDNPTYRSEGLIPFVSNNRYGFLNANGDIAIQPRYAYTYGFSDGLAVVMSGGKYSFIDAKGNTVINAPYKEVSNFNEGLAAVNVNGKLGYINKQGRMVIQPAYENAFGFSDGLAIVAVNGRECFINTNGKVVISAVYDPNDYLLSNFKNGLALIQLIGKGSMVDGGDRPTSVGYIDTKGTQYWED
jgi:hypothetical protein